MVVGSKGLRQARRDERLQRLKIAKAFRDYKLEKERQAGRRTDWTKVLAEAGAGR